MTCQVCISLLKVQDAKAHLTGQPHTNYKRLNFFRSLPFLQIIFKFQKRKTTEIVLFRQSAFLGNQYTIPANIISFHLVRIRVNVNHDAFFNGVIDPAPVHIQTARVSVQFNDYLVFNTGIDDGYMIDRVTWPAE